ncbi:MAG: signal recognition particle-docking protein FtsY [Nostocaceae cyanobacterium]|nr:signal recognition particle-docking protein FtsY [Nostocaceae cyanobacterium]
MVFNWFRRQFNDASAAAKEQKPAETTPEQQAPQPSVQETPATADEASTAPSTSPAADYLQWAKAAYKNIQEKNQQPTAEAEPPEAETAEAPEVVAPVAEAPVEQTIEVPEAESPAIDDATPEVTAVTETLEETTPPPSAQNPEEAPASTAPPEPDSQPALSFLARAAAERQARQERLIATAIEEPEAAPQPAATTTTPGEETPDAIPGLAFDEGFLWSAEVLAAQGRRPEDISIEEINWLKKLRQGLDKTRRNIVNQLKSIVGQGPLNQAAVMEIEGLLLQADVGVEATDYIINSLQNKLKQEALPADAAIAFLKQILRDMLDAPLQKSVSASFAPEKDTFNIWLIVGVNGAGKTTTIGKIAHLANKSGYKTLIGAADTFRAAAVEQVKVWGQRSGVEVIANPGKNTDPAAVVFDAIAAAQSRNSELLLVDTAGRLQNKKNLMEELSKVRRIIDKKAANAKVESLLVLDATLGQNGLRQAEVFSSAAQLSGVVLTKLDGTAKGGVALAVVHQLGLPIRFIGAGEGIEDLRPFSSYEFVEALLNG